MYRHTQQSAVSMASHAFWGGLAQRIHQYSFITFERTVSSWFWVLALDLLWNSCYKSLVAVKIIFWIVKEGNVPEIFRETSLLLAFLFHFLWLVMIKVTQEDCCKLTYCLQILLCWCLTYIYYFGARGTGKCVNFTCFLVHYEINREHNIAKQKPLSTGGVWHKTPTACTQVDI